MNEKDKNQKKIGRSRRVLFIGVFVIIGALAVAYFFSLSDEPYLKVVDKNDDATNAIKNGIHVATGFIDAPGMEETINNCTNCHSAQLVIQNRMNADRWKTTIRWMQKTQNLWDLGVNEAVIIDYLTTNYPPIATGRRAGLTEVEWYELKQ